MAARDSSVRGCEPMRLFVSVDLPSSLVEAVADAQAPFEACAGLRLTDPTQAHCTLTFLGDTDSVRTAVRRFHPHD